MPELNVSRRKVLAGIGTIGIASAGAGLGTTAFFSDEESLQGSLEAGKIDLKLDYRSLYVPNGRVTAFETVSSDSSGLSPDPTDVVPGTEGSDAVYVHDQVPDLRYSSDDDVPESRVGRPYDFADWGAASSNFACTDDSSMLVDGDAGVVVDLDDVKPKDVGAFSISLHICDNRAYLWLQTEETADEDVTVVEPEAEAGSGTWDAEAPDDGTDGGDLDDYLWVAVYRDDDCDFDLESLLTDPPSDPAVVYTGSLDGFLNAAAGGFSLTADAAETCFDPGTACFTVVWYLPCYDTQEDGLGFSQLPSTITDGSLADELDAKGLPYTDFDAINVVQTDRVEWTMRFAAIQCRHNVANANPYGPAPETVTLDSNDAAAFEQPVLGTTTDESRLGSGSWRVAGDDDGDGSDDKLFLWIDPQNDPRFASLGSFTVDDIAELSYYSKKPASDTSPLDIYLTLYTVPDGVDDAASWYGRRLTFEPYFSRGLNAPSGQWNHWSTAADGENVLTFYDSEPLPGAISAGFYGQPTLGEAQVGSVDWSALVPSTSSTPVDYGSEEILSIVLATGSGWADDFVGYFDGLRVRLTDGTDLTVDFEA